ncbi:hypothetical protein Tco_0176109 [Tanacetum coccineum]
MSALWSVEGGVPDEGVPNGGGGSDTGSGRDGICSSGEDNEVSGDGGGVHIASILSTSASDQNGVGDYSRIDILVVTRCTGGETKSVGAGCSSSSSSSSSISSSSSDDSSSSSSSSHSSAG